MKLQAISEAKYQHDPHDQFLERYFTKGDTEDNGDGTYMEMWVPKDGFVIIGDRDDEPYIISHLIVGVDPEEGKTYNLFAFGWDEPYEVDYGLNNLEVYKKVL